MNPYIRLNNDTIKELNIRASELCYFSQHRQDDSDGNVEKLRDLLMGKFCMKIPRNYNDGSPPVPKPDFGFMFGSEHPIWGYTDLADQAKCSDIYKKIWDKEPENE